MVTQDLHRETSTSVMLLSATLIWRFQLRKGWPSEAVSEYFLTCFFKVLLTRKKPLRQRYKRLLMIISNVILNVALNEVKPQWVFPSGILSRNYPACINLRIILGGLGFANWINRREDFFPSHVRISPTVSKWKPQAHESPYSLCTGAIMPILPDYMT